MKGHESVFEKKETTEQKLARLLKEKGVEDLETGELLRSWTIEQEKSANDSTDRFEAMIQLNLRRARLYFSAGYPEEANENFNAAAEQAYNEQRMTLFDEIIAEMDNLQKTVE